MKSTLQIALIAIVLTFAVGCTSQADQDLAAGFAADHAKQQLATDCLAVKLELTKVHATPGQMDQTLKADGCN